MSEKLFGTDGVRGVANKTITAELALSLAQAAAKVLGKKTSYTATKPTAILAKDPRSSGDFISAAVAAGLASEGVDVYDAGIIPTPAAAFLVAETKADFGVMISASHNLAADNGIKFFGSGGKKLSDSTENKIEKQINAKKMRPTAKHVGRIINFLAAENLYITHLLSSLPQNLAGLNVVLDCANGAATSYAAKVFEKAGAKITLIGAEPDGLNINLGVGSTDLKLLQKTVVAVGADLGIAYDGDADRCLAVDHNGVVVDGDQIMAILAVALQENKALKDNVLVATVMSNLGLKLAMQKHGIKVLETSVGDRYVLEAMNAGGYDLGGEQSGHVILSRYATTGDGLLTGLHLAARMVQTGRSLAQLAEVMQRLPQVLVNVPNVDKNGLQQADLLAEVFKAEEELGNTGRVLLRSSGTESVVRVMVEAATQLQAKRLAKHLAAFVEEKLVLK